MKFIHTADIHWGMVPDSDRPWGKKREQAIRLTFQAIIEDARDSRADLREICSTASRWPGI